MIDGAGIPELPETAVSEPQEQFRQLLESRVEDGRAGLTLLEAIESGLANTGVVRVSEGGLVEASRVTFFDVQSAEAREAAALAAFDAVLEASIVGRDIKRPPNSLFGPGLVQPLRRDEATLNFGFRKPLVSGGEAAFGYQPDPSYFFVSDPSSSVFNPIRNSALQAVVTQPLLKGAGRSVNLIPLQITQADQDLSRWEFKKAMMATVADITREYWRLLAALETAKAIDEALPLFHEIVRLQEEGQAAGWSVMADVAKARAQSHEFRQQRLSAEQDAATAELRLRNLAGLPPQAAWKLEPVTAPARGRMELDLAALMHEASDWQPDIVRQRLNLRIRELELAAARNGLYPDLDLNALYRVNGVGEHLGDALDQLGTTDFRDWQAGATLSVPLGRRVARASVREADRKLQKEAELLRQQQFSVNHRICKAELELRLLLDQLDEADQRWAEAGKWVEGARLRYQDPGPDEGSRNWLLENLNDYLDAIRFRSRAATDRAELLARYNIAIIELEEAKGTLLEFFGVSMAGDPCHQREWLTGFSAGAETGTEASGAGPVRKMPAQNETELQGEPPADTRSRFEAPSATAPAMRYPLQAPARAEPALAFRPKQTSRETSRETPAGLLRPPGIQSGNPAPAPVNTDGRYPLGSQ